MQKEKWKNYKNKSKTKTINIPPNSIINNNSINNQKKKLEPEIIKANPAWP